MDVVRIEVITSETKFSSFKKAISKLGVTGMTVSQVLGCGTQRGTPEYEDGLNEEMELLPKQQIMMIVKKVMLEKVLDVVEKELYSGHIGDGKIIVSEVMNIIRVRTGEEGIKAVE